MIGNPEAGNVTIYPGGPMPHLDELAARLGVKPWGPPDPPAVLVGSSPHGDRYDLFKLFIAVLDRCDRA